MSRKPQCPAHATTGLCALTWRTFLRSQGFGIVTICLGEAGRLSDELLALVRGWIARVVRCAAKVRNGISCRLSEPSSTLHPLRPSLHSALASDNWRMAGRRLITETEATGPHKFCTTIAIAAPSEPQLLQCDCTARLLRTTRSKKPMIFNAPPLPGDASASRPSPTTF